jgi:hypothetical protein
VVEVLAVDVEVAPIEARASKMAATSPPPGAGGGFAPAASVLPVLWSVL